MSMKNGIGVVTLAMIVATLGCSNERPDFGDTPGSASEVSAGQTPRKDSGATDRDSGALGSPTGLPANGSSTQAGENDGSGGTGSDNASPGGASVSGNPTGGEGGTGSNDGSSFTPVDLGPSTASGGSGGAMSGSSPSANGGAPNTPAAAEEMLPLGASCSTARQCESGFCADGVCCDMPCNGLCAQCNAPGLEGTCSAAADDESCPDLRCPDDTECRTYELLDTDNCDGLGQCALEANCGSVDVASATPCQSGAGSCNGSGECVVPDKAALGEACVAAADCGSGFCAETASGSKVCCNSACDQTCQACGSNGFCGASADDDSCGAVTCDADTTCADYPDPLDDNRCGGAGQCVQESTYCTPTFASATTSCGTGMFCDGAGNCDDACTASETWCTSACRDLSNDDANCGQCGRACPVGTSCVAGDCECDGATEGLCQNVCVDLASDLSNCGSCGISCPQPAETGSSRTCKTGMCGVCGAYSQACCSGASACTSGLSCSGGSCLCPTNQHRCTTGPAAGTCKANTDPTACGTNCENCTQPNAVAQCVSGSCNNTCQPGVSQLCAGTNGRPGCGSWDFEDSKQSWVVDLNYSNSASTLTEWGNIGASSSAHSLAVPYNNLNGSKTGVRIRVPLCGTVSLEGKTISGSLRLETTSGTPNVTNDFASVTLFSGTTAAGSAALITSMPTGTWFTFQFGLDSAFLLNPDALLSVTHVGLTLNISGWSGTIHLDNYKISDGT